MKTETVKVEMPVNTAQTCQSAIERLTNQLLRHDEYPRKHGRRFTDWDCEYLTNHLKELLILRETFCGQTSET